MTKRNINDWTEVAGNSHFETRAFIQGDYRSAKKGDAQNQFVTCNPFTEQTLATFPDGVESVDLAVAAARQAFTDWRRCSPDRRKTTLYSVADAIASQRETLALLDSLEMGMPIMQSLEQVDGAAGYLRYYAELIDKVYGEIAPADTANLLALSQPEPRGVIGVISPWNFPLLTAILAIAPALAAGNCLVVKPSEQTPSSVLKLAEIAHTAGLPAGVLNVVPGLGVSAGAALASHHDVDALHFTGSTAVGRQLMVYAGQSNGKPVMLELGGKSPQIVFEDAVDIDGLGTALAYAAFYNTGQLCVAKTRLLVHESIKLQVLDAIREATQQVFRMGNPLDPATSFGPLASSKHFERVNSYMRLAAEEGVAVDLLKTASEMPSKGYFIQPAIFDNARNNLRICQEEIFGPLLSVLSFQGDEQAIELANGVPFGLSACAWTKDLGRARRLMRDLNAGDISVCSTTTPATPTAALSTEPFGQSGHGILGGRRGLEAYQRVKATQIITD